MFDKGAANLEDWAHNFAEGIGSIGLIGRQIHETIAWAGHHILQFDLALVSPWKPPGKTWQELPAA